MKNRCECGCDRDQSSQGGTSHRGCSCTKTCGMCGTGPKSSSQATGSQNQANGPKK